MKYSLAAATLFFSSSALAQGTVIDLDNGGGVTVNGRSCPGNINNNVCCIGSSGGINVINSDNTGGDDGDTNISDDDDILSGTVFARAYPPTVTTAPQLVPRASGLSTVLDGVTCYGIAIPLSVDGADYTSQVNAALSSSSASPDLFAGGQSGTTIQANGGGSGPGTTIQNINGQQTTIVDSDPAQSTGSGAGSDTSTGGAPRITGAAMMVGGLAGAVVFGAM